MPPCYSFKQTLQVLGISIDRCRPIKPLALSCFSNLVKMEFPISDGSSAGVSEWPIRGSLVTGVDQLNHRVLYPEQDRGLGNSSPISGGDRTTPLHWIPIPEHVEAFVEVQYRSRWCRGYLYVGRQARATGVISWGPSLVQIGWI